MDYYNRQAQNYLREAEYYSKRENYDLIRSYQRCADDARDRAQSYMKKAVQALQRAK